MVRNIVILMTFILATPLQADPFKIQQAIKKDSVTIDELLSYMNIKMFKYKLMLEKGASITIAFKNTNNGKFPFKHVIPIDRTSEYTMWLTFTKDNGLQEDVLNVENKTINYSLNWNYESVYSGTIQNPLYGYNNVYSMNKTYEFGENLENNTNLIKFYSWDKESDAEELVAEIYIETASKK